MEHDWITMRDGVRLSARFWIPEGAGLSPAVLECIPYRKRDLYRPYDDIWGKVLAEAGIAFVRLDVRGTGDSEGLIDDEYTEAELQDCVETIAWIARQPWCSGAVGMRGISWGGINTLQVAALRPSALKAIMPMGCCDSRYTDDAHYVGGALARANFQWGVLFKSVMAGPPDPAIVGDAWQDMWRKRLASAPPILATWLRHQREDDYWKRGSVSVDLSDIKVPAYLVSGWSDTYSHPVLRLMANLASPAKALIGSWGHTYPYTARPTGLDWGREEVRWWRHWLAGDANGIMDEPRLRVFMPYATASETAGRPIPGRWIAEQAWPARLATRRYYLNTGRLDEAPANGPPVVHQDKGAVGATKPEWLDRLAIEQSHDDARSTLFDSPTLTAPLEILGTPEVRLRVASDRPVAHLMLRLCEVRPDGQSWLVTWAALNLTRRESMAEPQKLEPGAYYTVPISLRAIAHRFGAGSRIRLALSEGFWPMLWPSPERPTLSFATGVSALELPVRPAEKMTVPFLVEEVRSEAELLKPDQPAVAGPDGRIVLTTSTPAAPYVVAGAGTELSSSREETCEIQEGDPTSSRWRQLVRSSWKRDAWRCEVEASYELTSDKETFRVIETLRAFSDGKEIFDQKNEAVIPRDMM